VVAKIGELNSQYKVKINEFLERLVELD